MIDVIHNKINPNSTKLDRYKASTASENSLAMTLANVFPGLKIESGNFINISNDHSNGHRFT